ncbi:uncharacterized protein LOC133154250 isoform X1 [Syngnathus typhle]|uniref:uncharacterized protein LOC133154250 isoform X1 n=1 Tax=Syngnathus typhle TaxID=161592 RepID=UPI002A6ABF16|nr:uncharacterized protein LOC133154250 isoform X1 [Syngnathus typhle]
MLNPKMTLSLVLLLEFLCLAAADAVAEATPCSCDADNICTCNAGQKLELSTGSGSVNKIIWKKEGEESALTADWATFEASDTKEEKATIGLLKLTDKGTYVAIDGTTLADCQVKKVFVVKIVATTTSDVQVKRYTGNSVALHCSINENEHVKELVWKKDDAPVGQGNYILGKAVMIVTKPDPTVKVEYVCVAKQFDGAEISSSALTLKDGDVDSEVVSGDSNVVSVGGKGRSGVGALSYSVSLLVMSVLAQLYWMV